MSYIWMRGLDIFITFTHDIYIGVCANISEIWLKEVRESTCMVVGYITESAYSSFSETLFC
ncbi:hypothetical protein KSP40_PGU021357 [Platanthera guangdongensis]|uniref:Uncharacterized protein n=1 Tax=Platanthera guangdongensis TaxID=2320717 RepID=A0ABR2M3Y0_9ASPA